MLLKIHAFVAKILKMSARGEQIDRVWRDFTTLKCLSEDGSNTDVLTLVGILAELEIASTEEAGEPSFPPPTTEDEETLVNYTN
jgi:hypothetical protein